MNKILFLFLCTFLFADERCYFAVDMSCLPDPSREIVFENLLERGLQGRNPSGQPRDITHYRKNPDDSKRLVQGTFNETEITWFFNIPYVEFIGYNLGVNRAEPKVLDYLNSTDWYKVEVSTND